MALRLLAWAGPRVPQRLPRLAAGRRLRHLPATAPPIASLSGPKARIAVWTARSSPRTQSISTSLLAARWAAPGRLPGRQQLVAPQ